MHTPRNDLALIWNLGVRTQAHSPNSVCCFFLLLLETFWLLLNGPLLGITPLASSCLAPVSSGVC
jgi:hypothetical protein